MRLSVVIPIYETWHRVPGLLECLRHQTIDSKEYEIILVDNGPILMNLASRPEGCVFLHCDKPGSYAARNRGAEVANGQLLVFTDSDCLPEPDWLANLVEGIDVDEVRAGAVAIQTREKPNWVERFDRVKGIPQQRYVSRGYGATANLCVPSRLFSSLGGFDESRFSGGDADFCRRAIANGARLSYMEKAVVKHPARSSLDQVIIKTRRVVGGQIKGGRVDRRFLWLARTLFPPVLEWRGIFITRSCSIKDRLIAACIEGFLWLIRLLEVIRLSFGGGAERR